MLDIVVIGGGPVGLAAALHAHRLGLRCVVVEQRSGVLDKACGEGIMPGGLRALRELGVDPAGHALTGVRYVAGDRSVSAGFGPAGTGRGVRRTTLHRTLLDTVAEAGIEVVAARAGLPAQDDEGATTPLSTRGALRSRYVLAADGLHSATRRGLGLDRPVGAPARYGLRRHHAVQPWTDHVEVHWARDAEAYVTPVGERLVGVAVLSSARRSVDAHLDAFPTLRARLAGAKVEGRDLGAGPLRRSASRRVAGRVLLVGDAGGYVDALTGEGVMLGVAQAAAAVESVSVGDAAGYDRRWRVLTRRHTALTLGLVGATRLRVPRAALVPAAGLLPGVFGSVVRSIASS